jgi:hypothetical protein
VPAPGGGYETLDTQVGQVAAVSSSSMTVKSADGFQATYVVDTGTIVTAGRDGIADVKSGDTVMVVAVDSNGTVTAKQITDSTAIAASRSSWAPTPPAPSSGSGSTSGATPS